MILLRFNRKWVAVTANLRPFGFCGGHIILGQHCDACYFFMMDHAIKYKGGL